MAKEEKPTTKKNWLISMGLGALIYGQRPGMVSYNLWPI